MIPSSRPMPRLPAASHRGLPVISARLTPASATTSPSSAPVSSSSTTGSSGLLEERMKCHQVRPPRCRFGFALGGAEREPFEHDGEAQHPERPHRRVDRFRMRELVDALGEREQRAEGEEHEGDDERPEVALHPEAERVLVGGRALAASPPEEQQALVPGVGDRVDRLREHRRRSGQRERHELRDRDPEVGEERGDDRAARAVSRHRAPPTPWRSARASCCSGRQGIRIAALTSRARSR